MDTRTHNTEHIDTATFTGFHKAARAYGARVLKTITSRDYSVPESALAVVGDTKYQKRVTDKIAHLRNASHVILVGIGGSSLGTEAVYEALKPDLKKSLTVIDTLDENALIACGALMRSVKNPEKIALVVATKSGMTSETLMNSAALIDLGTELYGEAFLRRVVFIGNADTPFMKAGKRKKIVTISIPDAIGGRYSVFTAVGTVPLTLLGVDVEAFHRGAQSVVEKNIHDNAVRHAAELATLATGGTVFAINFFALDPRLGKVGAWYRQLLAESIGKPSTKKKQPFTHHLLPFVSTTVDFHSSLQLYLGGLSCVYTYFVSAFTLSDDLPSDHWLFAHQPYLGKHHRTDVMRALVSGVKESYRDVGAPAREIEFSSISAYELGVYMATTMLEVMTLCHVLGVNAFDQPQVESYKRHAERELTGS